MGLTASHDVIEELTAASVEPLVAACCMALSFITPDRGATQTVTSLSPRKTQVEHLDSNCPEALTLRASLGFAQGVCHRESGC